jgi:5-methylthioadenosine/S-adenosylhomocysteine deaminase
MITSSTKTIGLIGQVWDPVQGETLKTLVIQNGKISQLMDGKADLSGFPGIAVIELDAGTVLFPGLINLHTHIGYNILPIWESGEVWVNRFQWRRNANYKAAIGNLLDYIQQNWAGDADKAFVTQVVKMALGKAGAGDAAVQAALPVVEQAHEVISEIQAVAGGTTLIQETLDLDKENPDDRSFIIRNTGDQSDLQIPATKKVNSVVDWYEPNVTPSGDPSEATGDWTPVKQSGYDAFVKSVNNNNSSFYSTLVHVGEGKAGFIKGSGQDPYSKKEVDLLFQSLKSDITNLSNLKQANLVLTHGDGVDFSDAALLQFIADNNISWIWSPVSNLLLYRDTLDVRKLLDNNINLCLGSDWSPSGSKHVLDELKFASFLNGLLGLGITPAELYSMVTANPCKALGITDSGAIQTGFNADLFLLRKEDPTENALDALLSCSDSDIDFVMVNGRIVFGLIRYFGAPLNVDYQGFPAAEGAAVALRGVSINSSLNFDLAGSLNIIDTLMNKYATNTLHEPDLKRTKFMAADDTVYEANIDALRKWIGGI